MAMTLNTSHDDTMSEMNTTPLIDVMLVLLTLLIITLPMQTHAVKLEMPRPQPIHDMKPVVVDITIDFENTVYWNGRAVTDREQFDRMLIAAAKQNPQPELHIQPDRLAKYDIVAKVLSDAQAFGIKKVGFKDPRAYGR